MWILEFLPSEASDALPPKKQWLKPGHSYLFGRTKAEAGVGPRNFAITNKSVSRKHLTISVSTVQAGEGSEIYTKSKITITDDSKVGTSLDNEKFVKETKVLTKNDNIIKLGSYEQLFRISWKPAVFSFQLTERQQKATTDAVAWYRSRFEQLDIKTIIPFVNSTTTHVVSTKRNVPKCLQALLTGGYVVTEAFLDAIEAAASSPGYAEDGTTALSSPLEDNMELNWPDPLEYVPPSGKEPVFREPACFTPKEARREMLSGYTYIFCDDNQFENLQPVIANGGGKALKFPMQFGQSTVQELVQYVRNVAEKKGLEPLGDVTQGKGIVVVRFRGFGDTVDWALNFIRELDQELDQRSMEQNEFLDAILMVNAAQLRKPLLEEETQGIRAPSSTAVQAPHGTPAVIKASQRLHAITADDADYSQQAAPSDATTLGGSQKRSPPPTTQPKSRIRRTVVQSRFKIDDFDESQIPKRRVLDPSPEPEEEPASAYPSQAQPQSSAMQVDSQSLFINDSQTGPQSGQPSQTLGKRRAAAMDEDEDEDDTANMVDSLLPAANAMKKRRLAEQAAGRGTFSLPKPADIEAESSTTKAKKKRVVEKEIDVRGAARSHAQTLDAERNERRHQTQAEDGEGTFPEDEEIAALRDLAIIEDMEVKPRVRATSNEENANEWDERWNGRRNFKKFTKARRGARGTDGDSGVSNTGRKIIVPLEEVKRKDFGIGEEYWLESSATKSGKKGKDSQGRSQTQRQSQSQTQAQGAAHRVTRADLDERMQQAEDDVIPEEIAGQPREGPVARALREVERGDDGRTAAVSTNKAKRTAKEAAVSAKQAGAAKKPKVGSGIGRTVSKAIEVEDDDEDSDDGELKFRFRRKR